MIRTISIIAILLFLVLYYSGCSGHEAFKHKQKADQFYSASKYDLAAEEYTKAITLDPDSHYLYMMRGESYYHLKKYELAIADCTKAIQLKPDVATPYVHRGRSYAAIGKYDPAIADIKKAMEINPSLRDTFERLLSQIRGWKTEEKEEKKKDHQQKEMKPINVF